MLEQEVAFVRHPSALVAGTAGRRPVLLDGNGPASWGDGTVVFAADPAAVLEIPPQAEMPLETLEHFAADHLRAGCVGVAAALSYDLKHCVERLSRRHPWPHQPVLYAAAFDWAYLANRASGGARLVARDAAALSAARAMTATAADGAAAAPHPRLALRPAMSRLEYGAMLEHAKRYIAAGDIYQANLAQPFHAAVDRGAAPTLFAEWSGRYPAPFAAYLDGGDWALLSNSPECFLDVRGDTVATFPIKGTRPLGAGDDGGAIAAELAADPKDGAEHVMIVDLERNDLGRICRSGSVRVAAMREVRRFPLLLHMISEIRGTLRPDVGLADMLRATFPGGSITGAPKVRAMEIIEELEPGPRGFYTGSIGWIEPGDRARFNIAIRTAVVDAAGLSFHAGGGIVADSDPDREYAETLAKSQSLLRVLAQPSPGDAPPAAHPNGARQATQSDRPHRPNRPQESRQ